MKLKSTLPKDDANGIDEFASEARDNFNRGKTIPVIALLSTEDVHLKGNVPVLLIEDIEGVPDEHREHVLELLGRIKSDRLGVVNGAALDLSALDDEDGDE